MVKREVNAGMTPIIKKSLDILELSQRYATGAFFFVTLVVVAIQVINRLVIKWPITWTIDVSVFCFIWLSFLAASTSVRHNAHFRVTAIIDLEKLAGLPRRYLETLSLVVIIALSLILLILGYKFATLGWKEQSPGLGYPKFWSYVAIPFCSATAFIFALEKLWQLWRDPDAYSTDDGEEN